MGSCPMEKIGECNGVTLYFADSRFERPGVYYWDGADNVRAWPPEDTAAQAEINELRADLARIEENGNPWVPELLEWLEKHDCCPTLPFTDYELIDALETRFGEAAPAAAGAQGEEWRCFYCSEVFTDRESAALHFGSGNVFDHKAAGCQIDLAAYRAMEELVSRYQEEDAPIHRQMHRMAGEHAAALRREEERGYARGLRDSGLCPCSATPQPAAADGGVRERALRLLAAECNVSPEMVDEYKDRDVMGRLALRAIERALTQQHTAAAEHWHDLYRKECRLRQDDAARYGQQIVDLEAALSSHRQAGDVLCHRVRFQGDSVCPGGPVWRAGDIPASELAYWEAAGSHYWVERAYDYPPDPATLTRVHRLLENWERQAQLHGVRTFTGNDHLIFANELRAALVDKGAG